MTNQCLENGIIYLRITNFQPPDLNSRGFFRECLTKKMRHHVDAKVGHAMACPYIVFVKVKVTPWRDLNNNEKAMLRYAMK